MHLTSCTNDPHTTLCANAQINVHAPQHTQYFIPRGRHDLAFLNIQDPTPHMVALFLAPTSTWADNASAREHAKCKWSIGVTVFCQPLFPGESKFHLRSKFERCRARNYWTSSCAKCVLNNKLLLLKLCVIRHVLQSAAPAIAKMLTLRYS